MQVFVEFIAALVAALVTAALAHFGVPQGDSGRESGREVERIERKGDRADRNDGENRVLASCVTVERPTVA